MKDKAMKFVLGAVLVAVSTTAATANPTMIGGCEVERIKGSNAYFRTDANCVFGKAPAASGVRYSTKAGAVPSVSPRTESDQPNLWVRLGNLLTNEGTGKGEPAIDRSGTASGPEAPVSRFDDNSPGSDSALAGGGSVADGVPNDAAGNAGNNAGDPETESPGPAGASDATGAADGDNGHGNDVGGDDPSNPGQGAGAGSSGEAGTQDGAGGSSGADNANDQGGGQASATGDGNNGHGNDEGGVDPSNPGKGGGAGPAGGDGTSNGQSNSGGSGNGTNNQGGGQSADAGSGDDGNNGHGNDAGGVDPSNPGKGRPSKG
jgi:hypothetical protein